MNPIAKFLEDHHEAIATGLYFLLMAFAVTMPKDWSKGFFPTAWSWVYDGTQELVSMRSGRLVSGPAPKAAVEIPQPIDSPKQPATPPKEIPSV